MMTCSHSLTTSQPNHGSLRSCDQHSAGHDHPGYPRGRFRQYVPAVLLTAQRPLPRTGRDAPLFTRTVSKRNGVDVWCDMETELGSKHLWRQCRCASPAALSSPAQLRTQSSRPFGMYASFYARARPVVRAFGVRTSGIQASSSCASPVTKQVLQERTASRTSSTLPFIDQPAICHVSKLENILSPGARDERALRLFLLFVVLSLKPLRAG